MQNEKFRQDRTPLYLKIAEILRQRILAGHWKSGERLPTVKELMVEFEVARVTIREAVKILVSEGLVEPKRGRGTLVLEHSTPKRPLNVVTSLSELVNLYRGDVPDLVSLDDQITTLPEDLISEKPQVDYQLLRRMHSRDGQRYCIISLYLAKPLFDKHEIKFRNQLALPVLFDDPDIEITIATQRLLIAKCDMETAQLLDLSLGDPVANVRRILCDADESIVYLADVIYRGDYVQLDMNLLA